MRRTLALCLPIGLALAQGAAAESVRTLRVELTPGAEHFAVENLVGSLRVGPGSGDSVVAVATIHAESEALAGAMRFERVVGDKGAPTLRVRYPVEQHKRFRDPGRSKGAFAGLWGGNSNMTYDGARVSVGGDGVLLYADVEVQLPRSELQATFRNHVGPLSGKDVAGRLRFDSGSGDVQLSALRGEISADTGSGDVTANGVAGSFDCDTGSGDCDVSGFDGDRLSCDTGSGKVSVEASRAGRVEIDTGSGDVSVTAGEIDELQADTGSGRITLTTSSKRLARVKAETGSGDVRLNLAPDAGFEARADLGSGDIVNRFGDAQPIVQHREVVGYRRGDARVRISVEAGSGDLVLEPAR